MREPKKLVKHFQDIIYGKKNGIVYLYGAGGKGNQVYKVLKKFPITVMFIDTYKKGKIDEIQINDFSYLKENFTDLDIILVTLVDYREIEITIKDSGLNQYLICNNECTLDYYLNIDVDEQDDNVVEFYLIDAFEVAHFVPIMRFLQEHGVKAKIIAEPQEINTAGEWFDYEKAIKLLQKEGIEFYTECNPLAKWAVTTQKVEQLEKYIGEKINITYGVSLLKNVFFTAKESCEGFDYKFVHGIFQYRKATQYLAKEKIRIIGYPKYYHDYLNENKRCSFNTMKPVLLYLPTWDEYSTIKEFKSVLESLSQKYYIVCKMHHCTERLPEKKEDREIIYNVCDEILSTETPLTSFINNVDVIIADGKSGVATEVVYINPNANLLLSWPNYSDKNNILDLLMENVEEFAEIVCSRDDVLQSIQSSARKKENRKKIIEEMYGNKNINYLNNILDIFKVE